MKLILVSLMLFSSVPAWCDSKQTDEAKILVLEEARIDAMMTRDIQSIDRILSEDVVHITSEGKVRSKPQYLQSFKDSKTPFASFELENINVRLYGDIAISDGSYSNSKRIGNTVTPEKQAVFTRVYRKVNNNWQLISHQATEIND